MSKSPMSTEEHLMDCENGWRIEAEAVIADIAPYVCFIGISSILPCNESGVYLNLRTKEQSIMTIEMSSGGFRICGESFDSMSDAIDGAIYYETPYALLDNISPAYRQCFGTALADKLQKLLTNQ